MKYTLMAIVALSNASALFATDLKTEAALLTVQKQLQKAEHKSKPSYFESDAQPKSGYWAKKNNKNWACKRAQARRIKANKNAGN